MFNILVITHKSKDMSLLKEILEGEPKFRTTYIGPRDTIPPLDNFNVVVITSDFKGDGILLIPKLLNEKVIPFIVLLNDHEVVSEEHLRILEYSIVDSLTIAEVLDVPFRRSFLNHRIKVMCKLKLGAFRRNIERTLSGKVVAPVQYSPIEINNLSVENSALILGSSAGGPQLIRTVISQLPSEFPPVIVVQHMNYKFSKLFSQRLRNSSGKDVVLASDGMKFKKNRVYIAPGGFHLELGLRGSNVIISLNEDPPVNFVRPSVDVTIFSAVRIFESKVVVAILSGMGVDGREGARIVKKRGGKVIALRQEDTPVYGMNRSVIESNLAHKIVALQDLIPSSLHFLREM